MALTLQNKGWRLLQLSLSCPFKINRLSSAAISGFKEAKIKILDVSINYAETLHPSDKERPILFLPGAFGSIEMDFKPIVAAMGPNTKYKWFSYDPPGYGKSRPPKRQFLSKEYDTVHEIDVKYITGLMNILGYESYNLVAWSGAALSAVLIASQQPEKISGLVTFGSFGYTGQESIPVVKKMKQLGLNAIPEGRRALLLEMYGEEYLLEMWNGWCDEAVRMVSSPKFRKGGTFQRNLDSVQCPTLVMQGTKDALINMEQADHLHASFKNSRLHVVENGTHNLHLRNTDQFIQLIESFFDENPKIAKV